MVIQQQYFTENAIDINLGTATLKLKDTDAKQDGVLIEDGVRIYSVEDTLNYTTIKSGDSRCIIINSISAGTSGQYLKTDGSGNLRCGYSFRWRRRCN